MDRRYLFKSILYLHVLLYSANLLAQKDNFPFQQFERITTDNGLSNDAAYEVIQDKKGFLWFLTGNGLNRYDGYNFKIYSHDPADSNSLTGGYFYSLVQDKNGLLWFNSEAEGIYSFNPVTEKFFHFRQDPKNKNSLLNDRTTELVADKAGNIWIATQKGLDKLDPRTNTFTHITHQQNEATSISNDFISAITIDEDDNLWLVTGEPGLDYFNTQTQKLIQHFNFGSSSNPIEDWLSIPTEQIPAETGISGSAAVMMAFIVTIPIQKRSLTLSMKKIILFPYRITECIKYLKIKVETCGWERMLTAVLLNIMNMPAADFITNK